MPAPEMTIKTVEIAGGAIVMCVWSEAAQAFVAASTTDLGGGAGGAGDTTATNTTAIADATGAQADAPWPGTGDGTVIALLKAMADQAMPSEAAALTTGQFTAGLAAAVLVAANADRRSLSITNTDELINLYIGKDATLTAVNGHQVLPRSTIILEEYVGPIWGIVDTGTPIATFIQW